MSRSTLKSWLTLTLTPDCRSKKDRKEQKSSFRDILKFIEDGQDIYEKISFNGQEVLELDSWSTKKHYDMLCKVRHFGSELKVDQLITLSFQALTSGMNLYLTESELVRDIFQLGPPLPPDSNLGVNKPSKQERVSELITQLLVSAGLFSKA